MSKAPSLEGTDRPARAVRIGMYVGTGESDWTEVVAKFTSPSGRIMFGLANDTFTGWMDRNRNMATLTAAEARLELVAGALRLAQGTPTCDDICTAGQAADRNVFFHCALPPGHEGKHRFQNVHWA